MCKIISRKKLIYNTRRQKLVVHDLGPIFEFYLDTHKEHRSEADTDIYEYELKGYIEKE